MANEKMDGFMRLTAAEDAQLDCCIVVMQLGNPWFDGGDDWVSNCRSDGYIIIDIIAVRSLSLVMNLFDAIR